MSGGGGSCEGKSEGKRDGRINEGERGEVGGGEREN